MQGANLAYANLKGAVLGEADLEEVILAEANLQGANLENANLQGANLENANLQGANLENANLRGMILLATDLREVQGVTSDQLSHQNSPYLCNVALPDSIQGIDPNRDCEALPLVLVERFGGENLSLKEIREIVEAARQRRWE